MKCIKSIKKTKTQEIDVILRVTEKEADEKVLSGNWKFIPKSEWKEATRKKAEETPPTESVETKIINKTKNKKHGKSKVHMLR